jgi:hypothetical protein
MKVKFANGVVRECSAPTEQKVFKTVSGEEKGWILHLRLRGGITSRELDELLTVENIAPLEFLIREEESTEDKVAFALDGYNKITSSAIRYAEDITETSAEIQFTKGL